MVKIALYPEFQTEENLTPYDLTYFKYAPITSVDVEPSFFKYKHFLSDR